MLAITGKCQHYFSGPPNEMAFPGDFRSFGCHHLSPLLMRRILKQPETLLVPIWNTRCRFPWTTKRFWEAPPKIQI